MKKSKLTFAIFAGIILLLCLVIILIGTKTQGEEAQDPTTQVTVESYTEEHFDFFGDDPVEPTALDEIVVPTLPSNSLQPLNTNNVTIYKVDPDPNEVIDRTQLTAPSDPEYVPGSGEKLWNVEGKCCRNDKTITIEIHDPYDGKHYEISFGYITGACNRFIYLNPVVTAAGIPQDILVRFDYPIGGGYVTTISGDVDKDHPDGTCCTYGSTIRDYYWARYQDPSHPGVVWFPQNELDGPIYLDVQVQRVDANPIAILRLTITKGEDGTYSIADLDNMNIYDDNTLHPEYSKTELAYIVELAKTEAASPVFEHWGVDFGSEICIEKCMFEYRTPSQGLYFDTVLNASGGLDYSYTYADQQIPILAVNIRYASYTVQTFYFQIIQSPTETSHGIYQFIGRDLANQFFF